MSQAIVFSSRGGWKEEDRGTLWQEVKKSSASGEPLRAAFDRVARSTGRKPNSVRNFYYTAVKSGDVPKGIPTVHALPFTPFSENEVAALLREVLIAQGKGISVRACVQQLSHGDHALALRLQNKYRALLRSHRPLVEATLSRLRDEGQPCLDPYEKADKHSDPILPEALSLCIMQMSPMTRERFLDFCSRLAAFLTQEKQ